MQISATAKFCQGSMLLHLVLDFLKAHTLLPSLGYYLFFLKCFILPRIVCESNWYVVKQNNLTYLCIQLLSLQSISKYLPHFIYMSMCLSSLSHFIDKRNKGLKSSMIWSKSSTHKTLVDNSQKEQNWILNF